mgnify:CR=1 FL=1
MFIEDTEAFLQAVMRGKEKAPRLKLWVEFINQYTPYHSELVEWWGSFDRMDGKLRIPGKMRHTWILRVWNRNEELFTHNPIEAYRRNKDVAFKLYESLYKEKRNHE